MFDPDGWIARLGASLEALAPTATYSVSFEAGYVSNLSYDQFRAIQAEAGLDPANLDAVAMGYASLRSDAEEQRAILHEHPVLNLSIPSFNYQMTPKISLNTRCSISISENLSINGQTRSSDQLGIWSYNINP